MIERFERFLSNGHSLYLVDSEIEPVAYLDYLLRYRYRPRDVKRILRDAPRCAQVPNIPMVALVHCGAVLGFRVATWVGTRYARVRELRRWLRTDGFSSSEIASLMTFAKREPARPAVVKPLLDYGIRP